MHFCHVHRIKEATMFARSLQQYCDRVLASFIFISVVRWIKIWWHTNMMKYFDCIKTQSLSISITSSPQYVFYHISPHSHSNLRIFKFDITQSIYKNRPHGSYCNRKTIQNVKILLSLSNIEFIAYLSFRFTFLCEY